MRGWIVRHRYALATGLLALILVAAILLPELAEARVGGGQNFGRGGRSGGGSRGGGGGGGGGEADLIFFLLYLILEVPIIGIPLTLGVIGFFVVRAVWNNVGGHRVHRTRGPGSGRLGDQIVRHARPIPGLDGLRERDPGLSIPVLLDYLVLVHRRAHEALGSGAWDALQPFVSPSARGKLQAANEGVSAVYEIVVGGISLVKVEHRRGYDHLYVSFESSRVEAVGGQRPRRVMVREQWTFRRASGAVSLAPEAVQRLGCPSCGASIEVTQMGACRNCDTPITAGQLQWQATFVVVHSRQPATVPEVGWVQGGDEGSVHEPTLQDPGLSPSVRALSARHPDFDHNTFGQRVELAYYALQEAWSANSWGDARPFVTDRMFQTLRFWIERYSKHGLRNQLTDVDLERVRIVKVEVDAWYEAITVRLWGSMKDSIVDREGKVVGGNAKTARRFSEYWTFLRAAGGSGGSHGDQAVCPSCGAPLDQISQAGICGYCDSKITTGQFDWVLARIEQPEAYRG